MKDQLTSLLRHALTALAGIGALLAARGWIAPEDAGAVDAAGLSMGEGVIVVFVAVIARLTLSLVGKLTGPVVAKSGGTLPLWMVGWLLAGMSAASLSSCADYQGPRVVLGVEHEEGRISYDSAKGGTVTVTGRLPAVTRTK